jgi:hypothetical protein
MLKQTAFSEVCLWKKSKTFQFNGLDINTKLLLKPRHGIARVLDNYKKYWFDNLDDLKVSFSVT